jgi:hypothetical protein
MPRLDRGIQFETVGPEGWIAGSSPAMTVFDDPRISRTGIRPLAFFAPVG